MYRIIIVDDEKRAQLNLKELLNEYIDVPFQIIGFADTIELAADKIKKHQPDVVFMDIEMHGKDPFHFLSQVKESPFELIFVTAHEKYAVDAFKINALDYLLKPIDPERLLEVFLKIEKNKYAKLLEKSRIKPADIINYINYSKNDNRIILNELNQKIILDVNDIIYIEALRSYSKIVYLSNNTIQSFTISKPLIEVVQKLPVDSFIRLHRSFTVNIKHVKRIIKEESSFVVLTNELKIPVSRRKLHLFHTLFNSAQND